MDNSRLGEHLVSFIMADIDTINQDFRENCTMGLLDVLILGEQLVLLIEADTNIVNQDLGKNYTMRLMSTLTLGK